MNFGCTNDAFYWLQASPEIPAVDRKQIDLFEKAEV